MPLCYYYAIYRTGCFCGRGAWQATPVLCQRLSGVEINCERQKCRQIESSMNREVQPERTKKEPNEFASIFATARQYLVGILG